MVAVAAIACGTSNTDTVPRHDDDYGTVVPGVPDRGSAESILTQTLSTIYSWQPGSDRSPTDALIRAKQFLTGAALSAAEVTSTVRASAEWGAWDRSGDVITAVVTRAQAIPRANGEAIGTAVVMQTVMHRDGGTTPYRTFTATTELRQEDGNWKLATYPTTI